MNRRFAAGLTLLLVLLGAGGWFGWRAYQRRHADDRIEAYQPAAAVDQGAPGTTDVVTVEAPGEGDLAAGTTPMAERVAVLGLLNKRNGAARDLTMKPGQAVRIGDVIVRLRACERTAPFEQEQLTGGFVQVDVHGIDNHWRRAFSGWLFKERPNLNVVQHPIYDVWVKSCTMSFPTGGPGTVAVGGPAAGKASSAKNSAPDDADAPGEDAPIAADNNVR